MNRCGKVKFIDAGFAGGLLKWVWRDERSAFETEFSRYIGCRFAVGTSFGRSALYVGLKAIGAQGHEVILPAFTCSVVRHATEAAGAVPVFADINVSDFSFDLEDLEKKISAKTKAIALTHYFGRVARNMEEVRAIAVKKGIVLIEDCAHVLGARWNGRKVGTFGDFSIFSLTKSMVNFGGGMLTTDDPAIYRNAREIMEREKFSKKRRILNLPAVVLSGSEPALARLITDRIGRKNFGGRLNRIPQGLLQSVRIVASAAKWAVSPGAGNGAVASWPHAAQPADTSCPYGEGLHMEPLVASLGSAQLRRNDMLLGRRKAVHERLVNLANSHFSGCDFLEPCDAYTYLVLSFRNADISTIVEQCRKQGLFLTPTWPTHQRLLEGQSTQNVAKIAAEVLTWNIHPEADDGEIESLEQIVARCCGSGHTSTL